MDIFAKKDIAQMFVVQKISCNLLELIFTKGQKYTKKEILFDLNSLCLF